MLTRKASSEELLSGAFTVMTRKAPSEELPSGAFRVIRQDVNFESEAVMTFWLHRPTK